MKPKLIKGVSFAIAGLLALGGAAVGLTLKTVDGEVKADEIASITGAQIYNNMSDDGSGSLNGWTWSGFTKEYCKADDIQAISSNFWIRYTSSNIAKTYKVECAFYYGGMANCTLDLMKGTSSFKTITLLQNQRHEISETVSGVSNKIEYYFTNTPGYAMMELFDASDIVVNFKVYMKTTKPATITKGAGITSVYVSSNSNVTSTTSSDLKPSGTEYDDGTNVYGYAILGTGYNHKDGWTLMAGTGDTLGALYKVASGKAGDNLGTISATAKTKTIARDGNGGSSLGDATLTYGQAYNLGTPTRDGYDFMGWATSSTVHDPDYGSSLTASQVNELVLGNVSTLYAVWSLDSNVIGAIGAINAIADPIVYSEVVHNSIVNARSKYELCNATEKALVENYQDLLDAEAAYAALRDAAVAEAIGSINAIGEVVYTNECYDLIAEAKYAYVSLVTDEDRDLVTNYDVLEQAELTYDSLRDAAVANVIALIDAIGVVEYTQESFDKINAATDAYDALVTAYDRDLVTNYSILLDAQNAFMDLATPRIHEVEEKINAIGTVEYTAESKALIDAARSAFDALVGPEPTKGVSNYITLIEAEESYKAFDDQAKADVVKGLIDAIGEVKYPDSGDSIKAARDAYDALDKDQKELVSNYQTLLDAEATYAQLELDATRHEIKDEQSGVKVATSDGTGIPKNINLKVVVKTNVKAQEGSTELENIKKLLASDEKISNVFDVRLIQTEGGIEKDIQPSDIKEGMKLIVTIALPKGINVNDLKILHIHSESSIEFIENFKVDGNEVSFEVASLSEMAFIQKANTGLPGWAIALIVIGGVLLLLCLLYILFMFVFNKWCIKDNKVVRAIKLREKQSRVKVILFPLCFTSRLDTAVFSSKAEAEKFLGK